MWNQNGNGQGNGNGYGAPSDVYDRLNNTREIGGARFPYIAAGNHKLALVTLDEFGDGNNPKARALFKVLESKTMQPGSYCVKIWGLTKPAKFPNGTTEADEFADFMIKLKNAQRGYPIGADIRMLMKERLAEQLARGSVIDCVGVATKGTYVKVYWNAVQQSPQDIAGMRQRLEAEGLPDTGSRAGQQGQFQGAPHPSQMQGQYPAQNPGFGPGQQQGYQQPQYAPQQPAQNTPPYNGVPNYGQQPNPGVTVGNNQPVYQPAPPQGYPQQPQGVPPGGFLANVPPQNGGQGGGNGGGGWR